MIKRILIPLDPSPYTDSALDYGCFIAKQNDAEITGIAVLDIEGIEKSVGPVPAGGSYYAKKLREKNMHAALEQIEQLLEKFKEKCRKEGVEFREEEDQGSPGTEIIEISMFYDLIVMGLKTHFKYGKSNSSETMHTILDHSVTPILAVPDTFNRPSPKKRALIAFDGSLPSARSMQRFAQLRSPEFFDVTVLVSNENKDAAHYYLNGAEAYLKANGFESVQKEWTALDIIDAFKDKYYDLADLIVIGMHSKKGLFDFLLGSLSKYVIEKAEKAVLLGQ